MSAQKQLNPSDLADQQLELIAVALIPHLNKYGVIEKPMRQDKAAEFLDCTAKHIIALVKANKIEEHRFEENGMPYYFPSEINAALKNRKK